LLSLALFSSKVKLLIGRAAHELYGAGLKLAIDRGESGTYVKLAQGGADLFA
jgi:hypothetical protein